jgi:hypothetical protein
MADGSVAPALPGFLNETNQPSSKLQELELKMRMLQWRKGENDAKIKDTITRVNYLQEELALPRMALSESQIRVKWQRQTISDEAKQPLRVSDLWVPSCQVCTKLIVGLFSVWVSQAGYSQMREQEQARSKQQKRIKREAKRHAAASKGHQLPPNCKDRFNMKGLHRDMKKVYKAQIDMQKPKKTAYRGQELLQKSIADLPSSIDHSRRPNAR